MTHHRKDFLTDEQSDKNSLVWRIKRFRSKFGPVDFFATKEKESVAPRLTMESGIPVPRRRRSGLCTVAVEAAAQSPYLASGSISEENEEDEDEEMRVDRVNNNSVPNSDTLSRKTSEPSFERFINRFRRSSDAFVTYRGRGIEGVKGVDEQPCDDAIANTRKLSVDSAGGILKSRKSKYGIKKMRKSVSFSEQEHICIIEALEDEEENSGDDELLLRDKQPSPGKEYNKSLIPTFVFPARKPTFATDIRQQVILLEDLTITEDLHILGNVRVNLSLLKSRQTEEQRLRGQKLNVLASYSMDNWVTRAESLAFLVGSSKRNALQELETTCFRFIIDCSDMEIGQQMSFSLCCVDKNALVENESSRVRHEDDNGKQFYIVSCVPRLNPWALRAARELNNFAYAVKYNRHVVE